MIDYKVIKEIKCLGIIIDNKHKITKHIENIGIL